MEPWMIDLSPEALELAKKLAASLDGVSAPLMRKSANGWVPSVLAPEHPTQGTLKEYTPAVADQFVKNAEDQIRFYAEELVRAAEAIRSLQKRAASWQTYAANHPNKA